MHEADDEEGAAQTDGLSCSSRVTREAQIFPEPPAAAEQRRAGGAGVGNHAQQREHLARLLAERADHGEHVRTAVGAHADQGGRRQRPLRRIDDDAAGRERHAVPGRDLGGDVGFHVDRDGAGGFVQGALVGLRHHRGIDPGNFGINRARKRLEQPLRPAVVGRDAHAVGHHARGDHPVAGREPRRQTAGDADADDAAAAGLDRRFQLVDIALGGAAKHVDARPGRDLGLERQACDGDDRIGCSRRGSSKWHGHDSGIASFSPHPNPSQAYTVNNAQPHGNLLQCE